MVARAVNLGDSKLKIVRHRHDTNQQVFFRGNSNQQVKEERVFTTLQHVRTLESHAVTIPPEAKMVDDTKRKKHKFLTGHTEA